MILRESHTHVFLCVHARTVVVVGGECEVRPAMCLEMTRWNAWPVCLRINMNPHTPSYTINTSAISLPFSSRHVTHSVADADVSEWTRRWSPHTPLGDGKNISRCLFDVTQWQHFLFMSAFEYFMYFRSRARTKCRHWERNREIYDRGYRRRYMLIERDARYCELLYFVTDFSRTSVNQSETIGLSQKKNQRIRFYTINTSWIFRRIKLNSEDICPQFPTDLYFLAKSLVLFLFNRKSTFIFLGFHFTLSSMLDPYIHESFCLFAPISLGRYADLLN